MCYAYVRTCVVAMPLQAESKCVYTVHMTLSHLGLVSDQRTCMCTLLCVMHAHTLIYHKCVWSGTDVVSFSVAKQQGQLSHRVLYIRPVKEASANGSGTDFTCLLAPAEQQLS